jgi:phytoene dehydrogenase-like protein
MKYDAIIVGGGIAGLTATAYLSKNGHKTLLIEKEDKVGGLVSTFKVKDFTFDGGIRSIENSGIVDPMLKQLGLKVDFLPSTVSVGVEDQVIKVTSKESLKDYKEMLISKFPESQQDINNIIKEIKKIMKYLDILYGIDNPLFLDFKTNKKYFMTTIFPWMFKYLFTFKKIEKLNTPIDEYLQKFTKNQSLIDIIGQHFFYKTPAFFALSYFSLYLDYRYPKGGTATLTDTIENFIKSNGGQILCDTEIIRINPVDKVLKDSKGNEYQYKQLIWAADNIHLYKNIDLSTMVDSKVKDLILKRQKQVQDKLGGDSILTTYLGTTLEKNYFKEKCSGHFFYTPYKEGLNDILYKKDQLDLKSKETILKWLDNYLTYTTYEISIPGLRDDSLAPKGKTGLVVSTLMDYHIVKEIQNQGWYSDFKKLVENKIVDVLQSTIFPDLKENIEIQFSSTPLTIEQRTNNRHGAITGWAFNNKDMPAVTSMPGIAKSALTPIPDVYQAGQWSYSPAGLPISILTGKLAADKVHKNLK